MSQAVTGHRIWLIPICLLAGMVMLLYGWQQLHAQVPLPGTPGGPIPAVATEPVMQIGAVMPSAVKAMNVKNWDGAITTFLRFKYKTLDNRVITVHLPGSYKKDKMTREAWDTLFQCYGMDVEAAMEASGRDTMADWGHALSALISEVQKQNPGGDSQSVQNPAGAAMNYARSHLGSTGMGTLELPPLLPGMP